MRLKRQPNLTTCMQTSIAMVANVPTKDVIRVIGHDKSCKKEDLRRGLRHYGYRCRISRHKKNAKLPETAILLYHYMRRGLITGGHVAVHHKGRILDPQLGIDPKHPKNLKLVFVAKIF